LCYVFFFLSSILPTSTLSPYTTLFRSSLLSVQISANYGKHSPCHQPSHVSWRDVHEHPWQEYLASFHWLPGQRSPNSISISRDRSEEHTSELQSRENLVCRLLLEKKNT